MPITVPGKRSRTAAAMTCAVEWRRVSRSSLMAVRAKWSADYTKGLGVRLNGAKSLETGRDIVPAQRSLVERRLHVGMHLEHDRELVRQGSDLLKTVSDQSVLQKFRGPCRDRSPSPLARY